jgi:transcriptional regulator with XRE-family HTH domain
MDGSYSIRPGHDVLRLSCSAAQKNRRVGCTKHTEVAGGTGALAEMLAVDAGIDRTYVSRLERGLENPTVTVLEKLARAFSANIEELFRVRRAGETAQRPLKGGRRAKQKEKPIVVAAAPKGSTASYAGFSHLAV